MRYVFMLLLFLIGYLLVKYDKRCSAFETYEKRYGYPLKIERDTFKVEYVSCTLWNITFKVLEQSTSDLIMAQNICKFLNLEFTGYTKINNYIIIKG